MRRLQMMNRALCVVVLCLYLLPPAAMASKNLQCYHSIIAFKNNTKLTLHECPAKQRCYTAAGRPADSSPVVSERGCMPEEKCSQEVKTLFKEINFTMTYSCCDYNYCNSGPAGTAYSVPLIVTLLAAAIFQL